MALAGINGVEKFIYMILGVELEMRISEEEREDDVYYRNLRERLSSLEVLRSHWITHRRLAEFRKFLLHKLLVGPWQATRPMPMTAQAQVPVTLCTPSLILLSQCPLSPHTHTHTHTQKVTKCRLSDHLFLKYQKSGPPPFFLIDQSQNQSVLWFYLLFSLTNGNTTKLSTCFYLLITYHNMC